KDGQLTFITSNKYLQAKFASGLRRFLQANLSISAIINFGDLPVFDAAAYPCILIGSKSVPEKLIVTTLFVTESNHIEDLRQALSENSQTILQMELSDLGWQITDESLRRIWTKIQARTITLETI
ncbi:MAG: hypothetical protein J0M07_00625, partial [Anaerolineae bacterium]|nr:hypothetical protein [Anaerolineae bacterium]